MRFMDEINLKNVALILMMAILGLFFSPLQANEKKPKVDHSDTLKWVNIAPSANYKPIEMAMLDGYFLGSSQDARTIPVITNSSVSSQQRQLRIDSISRYNMALRLILSEPSLQIDLIKKWFGTDKANLDKAQQEEWESAASSYNFIMSSFATLATEAFYIETACPGADPNYFKLNPMGMTAKMASAGGAYCNPGFNGGLHHTVKQAYQQMSPIIAKKNIVDFFEQHYPAFFQTIKNLALPGKFIIFKKIDASDYDFEKSGFNLTLDCCLKVADIIRYFDVFLSEERYALSELFFGKSAVETKSLTTPTTLFLPMSESKAEAIYSRTRLSDPAQTFYISYSVSFEKVAENQQYRRVEFEKLSPKIVSDIDIFLIGKSGNELIATLPTH